MTRKHETSFRGASPNLGFGRRIKGGIAALLFFILLASFTLAQNYTQTGDWNSAYRSQLTAYFNADLSTQTESARALTTPLYQPLVADMNGDGTNEIIALDGRNLALYSYGTNLQLIDSTPLLAAGAGEIFPIAIKDLFSNNRPLALVLYQNESVQFIGYNGSAFNISTPFDIYAPGENDVGMLSCSPTQEKCIAVMSGRNTSNGNTQYIILNLFNGSGITGAAAGQTASATTNNWCLPNVRSAAWGDVEADGDEDVVISYYGAMGAADDALKVQAFSIPETSTNPSVLWTFTQTGTNLYGGLNSGSYCRDNPQIGGRVTSPYLADIDGAPSNGLESVAALQYDSDEFKMYSITGLGAALDDYPEAAQADGVIISDVMKASVFGDSNGNDFCVLGYVAASNSMDLVCASEETGDTPETREFPVTLGAGDTNISASYTSYAQMAHAIQVVQDSENDGWGVMNPSEILTPNGIYVLDFHTAATCQVYGVCSMQKEWTQPFVNGSFIPVDYQNVGRPDLIALTKTNLWYVDDGYSNTACSDLPDGCLASYTINPCVDSVIMNGTQMVVSVVTSDPDGDSVAANVILYYGDSNQMQSGWSSNYSSGTTIPATFTINKTITSGVIAIQTRETHSYASVATYDDISFSVGLSGVEYGDCETSTTLTTNASAASAGNVSTSEDSDTNVVDRAAYGLQSLTGLGHTTLWLIFMVVVGIGMFVANREALSDPHGIKVVSTITLLLELLLFILGVKLSYLGVGSLIAIVVVSAALVFGILFSRTQGGA